MRTTLYFTLLLANACGPRQVPDGDDDDDGQPCINLECRQVQCPGGGTTRLVGTVYAPTPVNPDPLPDITVYVPNAAVAPFVDGAACETCATALSGSPLVRATTGVEPDVIL